MSLAAFIHTVVAILDGADVPYMLTGLLAAAYYATPRATQGVDVVIDAPEEGIERLVDGLLESGFYVDRAAAMNAWRTHADRAAAWACQLCVPVSSSGQVAEHRKESRMAPIWIR